MQDEATFFKLTISAQTINFTTKAKKGLRDRNSPTCTLSQNGYGDRIVSFVHCVSQKSTAFRSQPLHSYFLLSATNLARHAFPKFYVISASFQTCYAMLHFPICLQMFLPIVLSFSPHNICLYLHSHIQLINGHTGIWTQGLPHAKRMWYHYTMCPIPSNDPFYVCPRILISDPNSEPRTAPRKKLRDRELNPGLPRDRRKC